MSQVTVVPWRLIDSAEAAGQFADVLDRLPISAMHGTSISGVLNYAARLFPGDGYAGLRQVIDVSGDGPNNNGWPVVPARDAAVAAGIVINGLPIMIRPSSRFVALDRYYADCVIGGPGSFVLPVNDRDQLAEAIRRKLVLEVAGRPVSGRSRSRRPCRRIACSTSVAGHAAPEKKRPPAGVGRRSGQAWRQGCCCQFTGTRFRTDTPSRRVSMVR